MPRGGKGDDPIELEDEDIVAGEELALPADERLPWLESDDEDEQAGVDTGRIVAFAAAGVLVLALLAGALWWASRDRAPGELVADGSTIEAPDEPYKTRPENPGGEQVEGTGNTSFAVAEGEQIEGRIAAPAPSPRPAATATGRAEPAGIGVQVGAYAARAAAEAGWATLAGRIEALKGRDHRIVEATIDSGRIYRLQAVAGTVGEAETLCREIKSAGGDCQVKR
jgi:hypothetical protein